MFATRKTVLNRFKQGATNSMNIGQRRNFATLVLAEHYEGKLNANLGSMLNAASQLNDSHVSAHI